MGVVGGGLDSRTFFLAAANYARPGIVGESGGECAGAEFAPRNDASGFRLIALTELSVHRKRS